MCACVAASALSAGVSITGASGVNVLIGGTGADTIDGGGGADVIAAGAGDDVVTFHGTESSIDGGAGVDTLALAASGGITAVNFAVAAGVDQTTGDSVAILNFENLNASAMTTALAVTGSSGANVITTGSGNDIIAGGGGLVGFLLGLALCVLTFQTFLLGVTREVLVFAPLFVVFGTWTVRRRWLERLVLALCIPCGYFLIQRYATGAFAG